MRAQIVSWNVHSWLDSHFRPRFSEMLHILSGLRPDVLCLQEARWDPSRGVYSPEIAQLRTDLELEGFAMCTTHLSPLRRQAVGHAILTRPQLCNIRNFDIGRSFHIRRRLLLADVKLSGVEMTIATTHLTPLPWPGAPKWHWEWLPRPRETRRMMRNLESVETPLVLAVDLNATPQAEDFARVNEVLVPCCTTQISHVSGQCLDYIFTSHDLPASHRPLNLTSSPSDHYPIAATLKLPD